MDSNNTINKNSIGNFNDEYFFLETLDEDELTGGESIDEGWTGETLEEVGESLRGRV